MHANAILMPLMLYCYIIGHPIKDTVLLYKHVIPRISANWQTVAAFLEYSITDKNLIKETHRGDPTKCCIELLEDWITSNKGVTPKTWERFVEVLGEIHSLAMVTKEIKQCLYQEGVLEGNYYAYVYTYVHIITEVCTV